MSNPSINFFDAFEIFKIEFLGIRLTMGLDGVKLKCSVPGLVDQLSGKDPSSLIYETLKLTGKGQTNAAMRVWREDIPLCKDKAMVQARLNEIITHLNSNIETEKMYCQNLAEKAYYFWTLAPTPLDIAFPRGLDSRKLFFESIKVLFICHLQITYFYTQMNEEALAHSYFRKAQAFFFV